MRLGLYCAAGLAALSFAAPVAAEVIYYQQGFSNNLYRYDTVSATETLVGDMGLNADSVGLAFSGSGTLYAFERSSQSLYTVNTATGATTLVGVSGIEAEDFTVSLSGNTGYASASGGLYSIDLLTGAATLIGGGLIFDGLTTARTAGTMAGNPYLAGSIFAVDTGNLYSVDVLTGVGTLLGSTNGADETLDFGASGILYGHGDDGFLYTIDQTTLAGTQLAATTPNLVFGMAVLPALGAVPEPATWAMLVLGFGALGAGLRSKRKVRVALTYA